MTCKARSSPYKVKHQLIERLGHRQTDGPDHNTLRSVSSLWSIYYLVVVLVLLVVLRLVLVLLLILLLVLNDLQVPPK